MGVHRVTDLTAEDGQLVHIPIVGHAVCAGFPSPADDFLEGELGLPRWLVPVPPASFLLNVDGECMRGAGIFHRDLALVDRSLSAAHDHVVVAVVDGALSIKRYVIDGNMARLAFDNPDMPAFAVEEAADVEIWGVVRFTIRWHIARAAKVRG